MILGAGYGTVSDFEIVWTLMAAVGFVFALVNLLGVIGDWRYVKTNAFTNGRKVLAPLAVFAEVKRAYLQLLFFTIGLFAMSNPDPDYRHLSAFDFAVSVIFRWGFLIGAALTTAVTVYAWIVRRQLAHQVDDHTDES